MLEAAVAPRTAQAGLRTKRGCFKMGGLDNFRGKLENGRQKKGC